MRIQASKARQNGMQMGDASACIITLQYKKEYNILLNINLHSDHHTNTSCSHPCSFLSPGMSGRPAYPTRIIPSILRSGWPKPKPKCMHQL